MARRNKQDESETQREEGVVADLADGLLRRIVDVGIDGLGPLDSAAAVADAALEEAGDRVGAVKSLTRDHLKLAAASGFVTNLGGFVTVAAALPANLVSFYALATRLSAAIAHVNGHDLDDEVVRAAVLLTLTADDADSLLQKAGAAAGSSMPVRAALRQLPQSALGIVNKGVAFRLVLTASGKGLARLGRFVPVVGGAAGAAVDAVLLRQIAKTAREEFEAPEPVWYAT